MSTIKTSIEEFKGLVASFCKKAESCQSWESLEAGFKTVSLGYLGLETTSEADEIIAVSYLDYASKAYMENEARLSL